MRISEKLKSFFIKDISFSKSKETLPEEVVQEKVEIANENPISLKEAEIMVKEAMVVKEKIDSEKIPVRTVDYVDTVVPMKSVVKEKVVEESVEVKEPLLLSAPIKERLLLSAPPIVSFENVTKKFGNKVAIQDVTFSVHDKIGAGELVSIVGPSGCGKSTILRIIAGLTPQFPHTSGIAKIMGEEVTGSGSDRGVVDQKYSLLPNLTVCDNISFGLRLKGVGRKERRNRAMEWVKKIGLEGSENKYPHELSGGMQQRVSLAATLILEPRILLMDEPFGALDPKTRLKMQELLVELWEELEATVFIVTHSMEEAVYLGDRVFRMEANPGRLIEILDVPRPDMPPEEMRKKKWFNEIVQELLRRIETGSDSKGSLYKKNRYDKDLNEDELELFRLIT